MVGNAGIADIIETIPGFLKESAAAAMALQQQPLRAEIRYDEALDIYPSSQGIVVETRLEKLTARAVLVATGARRRQLQVPGEEEFLGRGVSYCATCDGAFFRNSPVAVIGGGDSAVKEALYLADIASRVYLVHRREGFRAHKALVERMHNNERIILKLNQVVDEIEGDEYGVKQLLLKEVKSGQAEKLPVEGVFVSIGMVPAIGFLANRLQTDNGYIVVDESLMTQCRCFAAGDICSKKVRRLPLRLDGALAGQQLLSI